MVFKQETSSEDDGRRARIMNLRIIFPQENDARPRDPVMSIAFATYLPAT